MAIKRLRKSDSFNAGIATLLIISLVAACLVIPDAAASHTHAAPISSSSCNDGWTDGPAVNGVDGYVNEVASDAAGNIYAVGRFKVAGKTVANNVAKWDGTTWSALGPGLTVSIFGGAVTSVALSGSDIYAGVYSGYPQYRSRVMKWDGSAWAAIGSEFDGSITSIAVSGTAVYAGVSRYLGSGEDSSVSRWNGSGWTTLGGQMNDRLETIAVSGDEVYAGGEFTMAGATAASGIAKWNGTTWTALGTGTTGSVRTIAVSGNEVYAGGDFTTAGGISANRIAKWNGSSWSALGGGMNNSVRSIAISGATLYAGGNFRTADGIPAGGFAKWSGSAWSQVSSTIATVDAIALTSTEIYAAGSFDSHANFGIAKWNGTKWSSLGSGVVSQPSKFAVSGSNVYATGYFTSDDGATASNVARWNSAGWTPLPPLPGDLTHSQITALAVSGTDVYVGRDEWADEPDIGNVYKWNGTEWAKLGTGMTGRLSYYPIVSVIKVSGTDIYVGGDFRQADGYPANRIAKWNGTAWVPLGEGLSGGYPSTVFDIAIAGNDVYAGGGFRSAGGLPAHLVAKWNGTTWLPLGSGPLPELSAPMVPNDPFEAIAAIEVSGSAVYASGGVYGQYGEGQGFIAKWNGTAWTRSPFTYSNPLYAMAVVGNDVFAGGDDYFLTAGTTPVRRIAKWDGTSWTALGDGMDGYIPGVSDLAVVGPDIFVAGGFTTAGCYVSAYFARYTRPDAVVSISGRVTTPAGLGLRNATVSLIDQAGTVRTVTTSSFGLYSFEGVVSGQSYTITARSRRYRFAPRIIEVNAALTGIDLVGQE